MVRVSSGRMQPVALVTLATQSDEESLSTVSDRGLLDFSKGLGVQSGTLTVSLSRFFTLTVSGLCLIILSSL